MDVHKNAPLTPAGREAMVRRVIEAGLTPKAVSEAVGVSPKTVRKWVARFKFEGLAGLRDRGSRPHRLRHPTPEPVVARIEALRRQHFAAKQIAQETGVSPATISRVLRRLGLSRMRNLAPAQPVRRYERKNPGELIHIDIKKLGRFERMGHRITGDRTRQSNRRATKLGGTGWEYVHVCIDDASRIAFSQIKPDEKKESAVDFLRAAVAYYAGLGIKVERVMTDCPCTKWTPQGVKGTPRVNGSCYKAFDFRNACRQLGLRHVRTKPYTPKTNGKAERFIQTALREWAYAKAYPTSEHRAADLPIWMHRYNWHRPHGSLNAMTPISRLGLSKNNLLMLHI
jgi:transposase InsO family protein